MKEDSLIEKVKALALGVDIGGSHITTGIVDIDEKSLIAESVKRCFIDSNGSAESILSGWTEIIQESFENYSGADINIGIAMPGPFDYENGISLIKDQDKFKALYQVNIKEELAKRLNILPANIRFINDAAGFLQGEVFAGAAKGNTSVMGLTLGTGLGSAFCIDYKATDAALWDSNFLNSIAEDYLSTQWFVKRYKQLTNKTLAGVKELVSLVPSDHDAIRVFMEFGHNLAKFLIPIINQYKIDVVIVGGNIAQAFAEFSPELISTLKGNEIYASIKISELKENAALIGAAGCWDHSYQAISS
ncbi:ROK family protein [Pedobacter fastidiosus]|uniref:ROK family protein n=1 Tax=Pedobacter fastidiosus TaxID=2765361 RepID=A0ABR7KTX1_9SPHI|nr:ROK family protein [Pedobacter fastidiosus]MBC6111540.1 ROK family protein [Pedobacter fastidiosus]